MDVVYSLITAYIGSLGFALLFNVERRNLIPASIGGIVCWGSYLLCSHLGVDTVVANMAAAACTGAYAQVLARVCRAPHTVFYIPAVVPLIPGSGLYYTMQAAVSRDLVMCREYGIQTLQATLGIAVGITFVAAVMYILTALAQKRK